MLIDHIGAIILTTIFMPFVVDNAINISAVPDSVLFGTFVVNMVYCKNI